MKVINCSRTLFSCYIYQIYRHSILFFFLLCKTTNFILSKLKLPALVGPLSAIRPFSRHLLTFKLHLPWSLGYIRKLTLGPHLGKLFQFRFCKQPTYSPQEYQTCTNTALLGYQFTHWLSIVSEIHLLCPDSRLASIGFEPRTSQSAGERATTGPISPDYHDNYSWYYRFSIILRLVQNCSSHFRSI